jgi:hypothetical protein
VFARTFNLVHGAQAIKDDPTMSNPILKTALLTPVRNCKEINAQAPRCVVLFYVDYANSLNTEATGTTFVQGWRSTRQAKSGFAVEKKKYGWSQVTLGRDGLLEKEFEYADACVTGRWGSAHIFEISGTFYSMAPQVIPDRCLVVRGCFLFSDSSGSWIRAHGVRF